jgi:hypothetical protein
MSDPSGDWELLDQDLPSWQRERVHRRFSTPGFSGGLYRRKDGYTRVDGHVFAGARWEEDGYGGASFRVYLTDEERKTIAQALYPEGFR